MIIPLGNVIPPGDRDSYPSISQVVMSACACPEGANGRTFTALLGAAVCVGQMLGAAFFGGAADAFGRRRMFVVSTMLVAVAGLLTEMEDRLGIVIEDEDVDGEMLETYGGLLAFAEAKSVEA